MQSVKSALAMLDEEHRSSTRWSRARTPGHDIIAAVEIPRLAVTVTPLMVGVGPLGRAIAEWPEEPRGVNRRAVSYERGIEPRVRRGR
jgi:hypothetical protein